MCSTTLVESLLSPRLTPPVAPVRERRSVTAQAGGVLTTCGRPAIPADRKKKIVSDVGNARRHQRHSVNAASQCKARPIPSERRRTAVGVRKNREYSRSFRLVRSRSPDWLLPFRKDRGGHVADNFARMDNEKARFCASYKKYRAHVFSGINTGEHVGKESIRPVRTC